MTTTLQQAYQARQIQQALQTSLRRDVATLWPQLDPQHLDASYQPWLQQMMTLTVRYHGMSAVAAGIFYNDTRTQTVGEPAQNLIRTAAAPAEEWMAGAFGYTGPRLLTASPTSALTVTQGAATRIAAAGGRQTILDTVHADPKAVGFYRVTDGKPCAFCAMLAGRGVVYRSERTADFQTHDDCGCSCAPAFTRNVELPEVSNRAADLYQRHARGQSDPLTAFRAAWTTT